MNRRHRLWLLAAVAAPILVLTLTPGPATTETGTFWCVICGGRGTADGILNIALFVPLGMALGALGGSVRAGLALGLSVSLGIELAQFAIPNRFPGLGDIIYNSLGSSLGVLVFSARRRILRPRRSEAVRRGRLWGASVGLLLLGFPWLLGPAMPSDESYYAQWTPALGYLEAYAGRVLEARIDGEPAPDALLSARRETGRRLGEGARIEVTFRAGAIPGALAPIFNVFDGSGGELLVVGLDDRDLVVRYRTRARALRLDHPDFRWPGLAARWPPGDTIRLTVHAIGDGITAAWERLSAVPDATAVRDLRVSALAGWSLLLYPDRVARSLGWAADLAWMLVLALPVGLWAPGREALRIAGAWVGLSLIVAIASPLLAISPAGIAGILLGTLAGRRLRSLTEARVPGEPAGV